MDVSFASDRLLQCYRDRKTRVREWGDKIAGLYVRRVDVLHAARDAQELRRIRSLRFHALKGDRSGQYAIDLDDAYRLIVVFKNDAMTVVEVEEVSKHYDD